MDPRSLIQSAIASDISYLTFLRGQYGINQDLVEHRLADLHALCQADYIPDVYYSIKTGNRYGTAASQHAIQVQSTGITRVEKTARQLKPKSPSRYTLFDAGDQQQLSFSTEHIGHYYDDDMRGASGAVKKGIDAATPTRAYAFKKFHIDPREGKRKPLIKAARSELFSRLMHWQTAHAFEYQGKRSEKVCLVMDWVDGSDLFVLYRENKTLGIPFKSRLKGVLDIAGQLAALHEANFIYQDIKPENVMWDGTAAKFIDTESIVHESERGNNPAISTPKYICETLIERIIQSGDATVLTKYLSKESDLYMLGNVLAFFLPELFSLTETDYRGIERYEFKSRSAALPKHDKLMGLIRRFWLPSNNGGYADAMEAFKALHAHITTEYHVAYPAQPPKLALNEDDILVQLIEIQSAKPASNTRQKFIEQKIARENHITDDLFLTGRALATAQLKELMRNVIETNRHYRNGDHAKYDAIQSLYDRLTHIEVLDDQNLERIAKVFFRLALQNVGYSITGRTTSGKEIVKLLNSGDQYKSLMAALLPDAPADTKYNYDHLRNLAGGANDHSIFRKKYAATVFANFNQGYTFAGITLDKLRVNPGA